MFYWHKSYRLIRSWEKRGDGFIFPRLLALTGLKQTRIELKLGSSTSSSETLTITPPAHLTLKHPVFESGYLFRYWSGTDVGNFSDRREHFLFRKMTRGKVLLNRGDSSETFVKKLLKIPDRCIRHRPISALFL